MPGDLNPPDHMPGDAEFGQDGENAGAANGADGSADVEAGTVHAGGVQAGSVEAGAFETGAVEAPVRGADLARAALNAARAAARRGAVDPGRRRVAGRRATRRGGYSGAGPDPRDPQPIGSLVRGLLADRGWEETAASAAVLARWDEVVGDEIAAHCRPISLKDGELTVAAESTAWATQMRLLTPKLLARIRGELGPEVVRRVRVHGPTAPTWTTGRRKIAGRGPRDTYG